MIVTLDTAPVKEPVTVGGVKDHLRIVIDDDDLLLEDYIKAARLKTESILGRSLLTQTWIYYLNDWPSCDYIKLPFPPLQSVTSIKYKDVDESESTFSNTSYAVDIVSNPGRVVLLYGETWPTATLSPKTPIYIEYVAGYGDNKEDVPMDIRLAIMMLVGHWYEQTESNT